MPNITTAQLTALLATRNVYDEKTRKRRKAAVFAEIRSLYRIPSSTKLKVEIDAVSSPTYCVLKSADSGLPLSPVSGYTGPSDGERAGNTPRQPAVAAAPVWPYPGAQQVGTPAKPPMAGIATEQPMGARPAPVTADTSGPTLKLGSISLDEAMRLLRAEGDASSSFASTQGVATAPVFVRDERLYFVL